MLQSHAHLVRYFPLVLHSQSSFLPTPSLPPSLSPLIYPATTDIASEILNDQPLFPELLQPNTKSVLIAIDPDLQGAITVLRWQNPPSSPHSQSSTSSALLPLLATADVTIHDMPIEIKTTSSNKSKKQYDAKAINTIISKYAPPPPQQQQPAVSSITTSDDDATTTTSSNCEEVVVRAVMEYNPPLGFSGSYAWYSLGFAVGTFNSQFTTLSIPYQTVRAKTWKNNIGLIQQGKAGSIQLAKELLPQVINLLQRKKDHGRAESLLIAAWALGVRIKVDYEGTWQMKLEQVKEYVGTHEGMFPDSEHPTLGAWIANQRVTKRSMDAGRKTNEGMLNDERIAMLEGIPGWQWDAKLVEESWNGRYKQLKMFVSGGDEKEEEEEEKEKEEEEDVVVVKEDEFDVEDVASVGIPIKSSGNTTIFNGGTSSGITYPKSTKNKNLYTWMMKQKAAKWAQDQLTWLSQHLKHQPTSPLFTKRMAALTRAAKGMDDERVKALSQLPGWSWYDDVCSDEKWAELVEKIRLRMLGKANDKGVDIKYGDHDDVEKAIHLLQKAKRMYDQGENYTARVKEIGKEGAGWLNPDRIAQLEEIPNWCWIPDDRNNNYSSKFLQRSKEIAAYLAEFPGQSKFPPIAKIRGARSTAEADLGKWVRKQWKKKDAHDQGKGKMDFITPDEIQWLEAISGWEWKNEVEAYRYDQSMPYVHAPERHPPKKNKEAELLERREKERKEGVACEEGVGGGEGVC